MQILLDKVKADKKLVVAANMELNEAEAKAFWPIYDAYQKDLQVINDRLGKTILAYADAYNKKALTDEVAKQLTNEALSVNGKNILDVGNSNFAQLNDPKVNALMDKAEVENDPAKRNQAWGDVDKAITDAAPGIPWLWDKQPVLHSKDVNGVINSNLATWDFTATSIK